MKKLNNILFTTISIIIIFSCVSANKTYFQYENLIGVWKLKKKQVNYPEIIFNGDNTCIFRSMGDTIYRFKYQIEGDKLILEDVLGVKKKNRILKLTKTELIFETLWENQSQQEYLKVN